MDRRRAAAALLALAACIACSAAAPTSSDHTALDLYEGTKATEGCYYNFQHYGEGDRIMTNEPCLNCTCHNRMLMCYLRVCPFTKAIGQDCTVEKRADQCCPIVTCPDVPVDLLTSTSTSSPAEYGGTGLGKVDNYGCSINGKYFPEGAKVPPTPNKPCEHCYCIRNMTTCVMQECTLHVDGCTPIYHKDVCCPVRYFCDHPENEIPLLDDMTTTVRPTPGFLLTTTTDEAVTQTQKRECIENDQLYPDGALIKTEKPCVHCYCMKGDIVCVVQECGTPMENEGKNCTSLPPREGQCCPDTYICEGDELTTEPATDMPYETLTTLQPPRRSGVEGSGYRNEPDEITDTEIPPYVSEIEGSGEELETIRPIDTSDLLTPEKETTQVPIDDRFASTVIEDQYSSDVTSTPILEDAVKATTEPDKGLNTIQEEISEPSVLENTTPKEEAKVTESISIMKPDKVTSGIAIGESSKPSLLEETTKEETKTTSIPLVFETTEKTTQKDETEPTESTIISELQTKPSDIADGESSETSILQLTTISDEIQGTEQTVTEQNAVSDEKEQVSSEPSVIDKTTQIYDTITDSKLETAPTRTESFDFETTKTPPKDEADATVPTVASEKQTVFSQVPEKESVQPETPTPSSETMASTESAMISEENTIPSKLVVAENSEPSLSDKTTQKYDTNPTIISEHTTASGEIVDKESTEPSLLDKTTTKDETKGTGSTISDDKQPTVAKEDETITTEPTYRKEDEDKEPTDTTAEREIEKLTTTLPDLTKETAVTSEYTEVSSLDTITPSTDYEHKPTTAHSPDIQVIEETAKQSTTESLLDVSDVTKAIEESGTKPTTSSIASEVVFTSPADEKQELPLGTTANPEDNEIGEDTSPTLHPGRIPGEGDCLLNGITYVNDSSIPSNNKCHSSCKCVSSIIKCDPIICSPQPEYMDNCQPIYDTPESCCPTYICDHPKETIPPQPHSQMSGTESPQSSPSVECNGDQCEVSQKQQPTSIPTKLCTSGDCKDDLEKPIQPYPSIDHPQGCTDDKCTPTKDVPQLIPAEPIEVSQACDNLENCKDTHIPDIGQPPCEGKSCINVKDEGCDINNGCDEVAHEKPCEGENCKFKPEITPDESIPQICDNEHDCKETKIPETVVSLCEGESCKGITNQSCDEDSGCEESVPKPCEGQDCATQPDITHKDSPQICENQDDCKETKIPEDINKPSQPSHDENICTEEIGCKKPEDQILQECVDETCRRQQTSDVEHKLPSECKDPECFQQAIYPSQETTINVQLGTESPITSPPISEPGETSLGQDNLGTTLPEPTVTQGQEKYTELPFATSPIEYMTDKPYTLNELPESTITEKEEVSTRNPEEFTTKLSETSAQESGTVTELPEIRVTATKSEEDNTVPSETTVKEEHMTEIPAVSITEISSDKEMSSEPAEGLETSTEGDKFTEPQAVYTIKSEESVTEHKDTSTTVSSPSEEQDGVTVPHVTESEGITHAPEVSEIEQPEQVTAIPELLVTESERETKIPEHLTTQVLEIITKSPVMEIEQEVTTEDQKLGTELLETPVVTPEIEPTIPSLIESHETSSDQPQIIDVPGDSVTKTQEMSTETVIEHESNTKVPLSTGTMSSEQYTELPQTTEFENKMQTELPISRFTGPQESITNVPPLDIDTQKPTEVPESLTSSVISTDDDSRTKAPELYETGEKGVITEEGNLPQIHTTQSQEVSSTFTEKTTQQKETYTKLPLSTESEEYGTKTPDITIKEQEVNTDSAFSHATELEQTDVTPSMEPISGHDTQTELPSNESEPSISEEETKTEIPESHKTEPETIITEAPDQYITSQEEASKISDKPDMYEKEHVSLLPISTETPHSLVTGQEMGIETLVPEQQTPDESPVTEKEEIRTEVPITSVTEVERVTEQSPSATTITLGTESPYVPTHEEASSEIPELLFSEKESTAMVTEAGESSITDNIRIPEQQGEQEIHTKSPLPVFTEQHESGTTALDKIVTELSETETEIPVMISTESQKSTEIPSETTKIPEPSLTEESTSSPDIKQYTLTTQESSDFDHEKETTESLETIKPDQTFSTDSPALLTTHQESVTESELHETITEEKITKSPEQEEMPTTKSYVPDHVSELGEITTKVPYLPESHISETGSTVSEQEFETKAPKIEPTKPQEFEIKTEEPSVIVTKKSDAQPEKEDMQTEPPAVQETDMVPPKSDTEYHEQTSTEQSVITTMPSNIRDVEQDKQTELPISSVTESEEMDTKQPTTIEDQDVDKKEPKPAEIVPIESPEITESPLVISTKSPSSEPTEVTKLSEEPEQTTKFIHEYSETTPYLVELEEHPHKVDEEMSTEEPPSEEPIIVSTEVNEIEQQQVTEASTDKLPSEEAYTELPVKDTHKPYDEKEGMVPPVHVTTRPELYPTTPEETTEKSSEPSIVEETSKPEAHLPTVASEEVPEKSSEPTPAEEAEPELHQTTLASVEIPSESTLDEESTSKPDEYRTTSVLEETTEKYSKPTSIEELPGTDVEHTSVAPVEIPERSSESSVIAEETTSRPAPSDSEEPDTSFNTEAQTDRDKETATTEQSAIEDKQTTSAISPETGKPSVSGEDYGAQTEKDNSITSKPLDSYETTAPEEEFIPAKTTTAKVDEKDSTQSPEILDKFTKPEEKPDVFSSTITPESSKPGFNELQPTDEVPSSEDEGHFPPSGGYGQEPDYVEEDQPFGPGTCRYGGKVYVSAQQIPRDDPCDFCFCFRSDIICLQQSCPPPIHGCHEEPIQGFCCPRYECPVSMATTLNVTTTTTTTTTTLPPHFLPHAYKGAALRRGCQIKGHTYKVGEVVRASSGPCLHCTCGGDGQMKCDPKVCTPEPMLRQMIAAAVSSKRRR